MPEAEAFAGDDHLGADRPKVRLGELLGLELLELVGELEHERLLDPGGASSSRRRSSVVSELDAVAENDARVGVERDDGRR